MTARAAADGVLAEMLIEGDRVSIRPASAEDLLPLQRMHDRCSLNSRVHRWLGHISAIPHDYLAEAVRHDPRHLALVAHVDGPCPETVALASAVHVSGTNWEIGILIEDRYQRKGLGSRLLDLLVSSVPPGQCRYLIADGLADHQPLLNRLARYGELTMTHDYDGVVHAVVKRMHNDVQLRRHASGRALMALSSCHAVAGTTTISGPPGERGQVNCHPISSVRITPGPSIWSTP